MMLRNLKKFFNINFKIEECQDDVYDSDSDGDQKSENGSEQGEQEQIENKVEDEDLEKPKFQQTFIFSCIGVGLTNFARKTEWI